PCGTQAAMLADSTRLSSSACLVFGLVFASSSLTACSLIGVEPDEIDFAAGSETAAEAGESGGAEDGTTTAESTSSGDGDGDPTTGEPGDGDGDPGDGDGDGDPTD